MLGITIGVGSPSLFRAFFPNKKLSDAELDELQGYVEQINKMTDTDAQKMGVIIASGEDLRILRFSQSMLDLLKIPDGDSGRRPQTISDLLPHSFRGPHDAMMRKVMKKGALPAHLLQPLKNVDLLFPDGECRKVTVSLGKLEGPWGSKGGLEGAVFSAVVSLVGAPSPPQSRALSPISKPSRSQNFMERFSLHMYGRQLSDNLTSGRLPPTENHPHVGIMFVKWKCHEGGSRLTKVHVEIERLLAKHCIRRIQSWGDCYLVAAGTSFVEGDDRSSMLARLAAFAVEAYGSLRREETVTSMTYGAHAGPVSIVFVPSASGAPSMTVFGDTVNTAARMEQSSDDGLLHVTALAARELHLQTDSRQELLFDVMDIKSKGTMGTAWFDCASARFTSLGPRESNTERVTSWSRSWVSRRGALR